MTKRSVRRHVHSAALSSSPSASTLSPLTVFPRPSRSIKQIWWSQNQNRLFSSFYAHNPQAFARATSPTCHDVEAAEVRRVYSLQQLETLRGPATSPLKNEDDDATYTLVPSQRLARLERLEAHLQEEQARLETRCVWTFRDTAISARLPIQFVVVAVNSILDAAIRDASAMWSQRYLSTFQLPPSVATAITQTTKHLDHLDHLQRVNKSLKQPRLPHQQLHAYVTTKAQLAALHRQAMELQETFGLDREEHLQRCHMQWMDARARQADYKRYVELALRFQPLSEVDFNATPWPGRLSESRYHACAQRLGKFYATYGPLRRGKKKAAATRLQAFVRGCRDRRRYRPAMAMRQRSWRKLCCRTCIAWHDWTVKSIRAKRILGSVLASKQRLCFTRWQQFTNDMRRDKERRIKESLTRLLTNRTLAVFGRWRDHTRRCRRVCVLHARAVAAWRGHVFHKWHHGVHTIKLERLQATSCLRLQTRWRCVLAKRAIDQRRQEHKQAVVTIQKLRRGFQSRRQVNVDAIRQTQCDVYVERAVRLKREIAIASEARRRRHKMACLAAAEHDASVAEQAQQATKDGKRQLSKLARIERENHRLHDHGGFLPKYTMTKKEATAVVAQNELDKALESARDLARHDFRLKQPPRFACLHPHDLQASFATEEEYLTHVNCPCHGSVAGFHMALEQTPLDWLPSTLATASLLRLWAATQSGMHSPSACLLSAQPLADVMAVPLTSLPDDVAQALKDLKSSCLAKQVEPRTLLRQAALLRWCVLTQFFQLGGLPVVKIPSTADIYKLHSRRYYLAKAVFYSSWAAKQYKLLLPHLQRDALKTLQTIGDNARQNIVHRRQRAMHWLHQRASFAFLLLIGRRSAQSVAVTNRARSQLWSFSTQAKNGHRQRRQTLTQLQRQRRHAYVRLDHAAWLAASASLSLVVSTIVERAAWNIRRQQAQAFLLDVVRSARMSSEPLAPRRLNPSRKPLNPFNP
ncbi:hypothetical protein AeNC1_009168 [Aphanomyces euteiches]|nr:hypothetical protein AeNC1_009168 [Aphanomyces euteiches]